MEDGKLTNAEAAQILAKTAPATWQAWQRLLDAFLEKYQREEAKARQELAEFPARRDAAIAAEARERWRGYRDGGRQAVFTARMELVAEHIGELQESMTDLKRTISELEEELKWLARDFRGVERNARGRGDHDAQAE